MAARPRLVAALGAALLLSVSGCADTGDDPTAQHGPDPADDDPAPSPDEEPNHVAGTDHEPTDHEPTDDEPTDDEGNDVPDATPAPGDPDAVPPEELPDPREADRAPDIRTAETRLAAEVEQVLDEVTAATGARRDTVEVRVVEEVTWPDGSLGCPRPDGMYTQALVEGYRIVVAVDGEERHFHGARGEAPFPCPQPRPPLDDA